MVALFLTDLVQAGTQENVEPRSGIIVRRDQKVWFDGSFTRTESYGSLSLISVMSDQGGWVAYPELNRVSTNALQMPSYQEQVRTFFISQTTNRERHAEEEFLGLPCWRYGWVETNLPAKFAAAFNGRLEVWHLFLANPAFPLGLRWGHVGS